MPALLAAALALCAAPPATLGPGAVVVLARAEVRDPGLAAELAALLGDGPALVLALGDAPGAPEGDAAADTVRLAPRDRAAVDDRALADRVRAADAVELVGGPFHAWHETLFRRDGAARLAHALYDAHAGGATLLARGPAAGFLAGATMVPRAALTRPERDPHETRPAVALVGAAYGPPALVDARGWPVGDPVELLLALHDTKVDLALFLEGEVGVVHTREPARLRVVGPGRVTLIDLDGTRRRARWLRRGRVSVLARGDGYDLDRGLVLPAPERAALDGALDDAGAAPELAAAPFAARWLEAARSAAASFQLVGALAPDDPRARVRVDAWRDEDTRRARGPDGVQTLVGLAFDAAWD